MSDQPSRRGGARTPGPGKKLGQPKRTFAIRKITIQAPAALIDAHDTWRKTRSLSRTEALAQQCQWKPESKIPTPSVPNSAMPATP